MGFFDKKKVEVGQSEREKELVQKLNDLRIEHDRKVKHTEEDNKRAVDALKADNVLAIKALENKHKLELDQRDFDLKNQKDVEILKYKEETDKAKSDMLVLAKELEVTQKIVDINADLVDVKDVINKLITALPKIDLNSITVNQK